MNRSAWLTMTTQCEKLQVLTLRILHYRSGADENVLWTCRRRHEHQGNYHEQVARSFLAGQRRSDRRITSSRAPFWTQARRPDPLQGLYRVAGLQREEPHRTPSYD